MDWVGERAVGIGRRALDGLGEWDEKEWFQD